MDNVKSMTKCELAAYLSIHPRTLYSNVKILFSDSCSPYDFKRYVRKRVLSPLMVEYILKNI